MIQKFFSPTSGTATRAYSFNDFFIAKSQNMINNPTGIGVFICVLVFIALIFVLIKYKNILKKENTWILITLAWLLFTFLGYLLLQFFYTLIFIRAVHFYLTLVIL